jgi:hypothetical protein
MFNSEVENPENEHSVRGQRKILPFEKKLSFSSKITKWATKDYTFILMLEVCLTS